MYRNLNVNVLFCTYDVKGVGSQCEGALRSCGYEGFKMWQLDNQRAVQKHVGSEPPVMSLGQHNEAGSRVSWAPCRPHHEVSCWHADNWDVLCSVSRDFHLRSSKESISLSYLFSLRKHTLSVEFLIDSP